MTDAPTSAAEAERRAEQIREELGDTIEQLKENLRPSTLAHEAYRATRSHTPDWLVRYWAFAQSPAGMTLIGVAAASAIGAAVVNRQRRHSLRMPRRRQHPQR